MAKPKIVLLAALVLLLLWALAVGVQLHFDVSAMEIRLGRSLTRIGLAGVGSNLIASAAGKHLETVRQLKRTGADPEGQKAALEAYAELVAEVGQSLLRQGRSDIARELVKAARKNAPDSDALAALDGRLRAQQGKTDQAKAALQNFLRAHNKQGPLCWYELGLIAAKAEKLDEAEKYWSRSLEQSPDRFETQYALAQLCHAKSGDQARGLKHAAAALQLAETPAQVGSATVLVHALGGEAPPRWIAWSRAALHGYGKLLLFLLVLLAVLFAPSLAELAARPFPVLAAHLVLRMGRTDPKSFRLYERALERSPDNQKLLAGVADAFWRVQPGSERAVDLYQRLWQADRQNISALARLAEGYLSANATSPPALEAYHAWFRQCENAEQVQQMASLLSRYYMQHGEQAPEEAVPVLETALQVEPDNPRLQSFLGRLCHEHGLNKKAVQYLLPLAEAAPDDEETVILLGQSLVTEEQFYLAYRYLRDLPPSDEATSVLYVAGVGCEQEGRLAEATRILQEVALREPGYADVQERLAALSNQPRELQCGDYRLLEPTAEAETYTIHQAQASSGQRALVAVFKPEYSDALRFPKLFAEHVAALSELKHETIAPIAAYGESNETFYIAHLVPAARTVAQLLREREALSLQEAGSLVAETLRGLQAAHEAGFLHGDLAPRNVLLTEDQHVLLFGFGYAAIAEAASGESRAALVGDQYYSPPERVRKEPLTPQSDIYAVGCLLYHLLAGRPPFEGASRLATMMQHVTGEPEPPSHVRKSLYPDADPVALKALAKDPAQRYSSAAEFREAIIEAAGLSRTSPRVVMSTPVEQPPEAESGEPGLWWEHFDQVELVKTGRFARIYRGVDRALSEVRAIKELNLPQVAPGVHPEEAQAGRRNLERLFRNETNLLASLSGTLRRPPAVVKQFQTWPGEGDRTPAYSMELLERTLEQRIALEGALPAAEALRVAAGLAEAVNGLHEMGIVHRNLSPRSVMFARDGSIRLVGFDRTCRLADHDALLAAERAVQRLATSPVQALGDPGFLSPEQCRTEPFGLTTDVYSLGCIVYYLLAGRPPFVADDPIAVMLAHVAEPPPSLADLRARAPAGVDEMLARALAKKPEERFPDAGEFYGVLEKMAERASRISG